jgi:predicted metal-dependent HD superfamily phosphohydrolase
MIDPGREFWAQLESRYEEPPRHYHTFDHVRAVLRQYEAVQTDIGWDHPTEVWLAVLCHDAIYEVGKKDNETRSAEFARELIERWLSDIEVDTEYVSELIELTARHGRLQARELSPEQALFVDCDMAILGADPEQFAAFERGVEAEYTQLLSKSDYAAGRREFLQRVLDSDRIYLSDYFHSRLDGKARENIARQLSAL